MSAFMCSDEHVNRILDAVRAADRYSELIHYLPGDDEWSLGTKLTAGGRAMHAENLASMKARYTIRGEELAGYREQVSSFVFVQGGDKQSTPTPVEGLKLIASWRYQSCEHPASKRDTATWDLVRRLEKTLINALPGYDAAEWSV